MKICDITISYSPTSGGIRTYLQEKRKYIREHTGHKYMMIVPGAKDSVTGDGSARIYTIAAPLVPGCKPYRFFLRVDKILAILRAERPDIVELGTAYFSPWAAFSYRRRHRCVVTGYYHTDYPTAYVRTPIESIAAARIARRFEQLAQDHVRWVYNRCDATIAASLALLKKLQKLGVERVHEIPLGVDLETFHPRQRDPQFRRQLGLSEEELLLVYAGRLDMEKRVDVLLEAFRQLPATFRGRLLLVGDGPLKHLALDHAQKNPRIQVLPYQSKRPELAGVLASADIYVTAGPHETFGLSILEAQACGLPVVGVKAGALTERVREAVGVLAEPNSAASLASGIMELATNGFRQRGENARRLAEKNYAWPKTFYRLFALYEQLYAKKCLQCDE